MDPCDLVEETLAAIAAYPDKALFIEVAAARARKEAAASRSRLRAGLPLSALDGVSMAWKDLFDVEGRVTTAGSVVLQSEPPAKRDAALLRAAVRAGLITIGLVNMSEFAYSSLGLNPHYGTPRNPRDPEIGRSPGGSSSGSAVAVAAGLAPLAIGTDSGGSIRIPASFNGVVGYKSSTGHYPMDGVFPLSRTLDSLGPLANTVEDCVLVDAALRGVPTPEARPAELHSLRIVVPETVVLDGCEAAVVANFETAITELARAGACVERRAMPQLAKAMELVAERGHLLGAEALQLHRKRLTGPDADRMDRRVVERMRLSEHMTAVDLDAVIQTRKRLITESNALIGEAIVAFPTTSRVAMPVAPLEADDGLFARENMQTVRNAMLGNFLDWCGVAIPNGVNENGMPTSLLLSAVHGRDMAVLSAALTVEAIIRAK
ncbi:amidase [Hyphomicrobiales bacterium BP6-180914]|uniref:Indoleacetamide hydrolase n=1 Tax=Lichenifustis flavocetrariae TaxID=2949735 RepID=A0AA42CNB1_9HYPH|nr:amidase [Lichenifustis flavocetrariae]